MIKGLPYDAEIEYLESTGTQWIDTGVYPNGGTDWELCMFMPSLPNGNVFGSRNVSSGTPAWGLIAHSGGTSWSIARLARSWNEIFPAEFGTVNVYAFRDGVATYNGEPKGTGSGNVQVNYPAVLYAYNNGGNIPSPSVLRVLYCKIWQDGTLVRDFIPVRVGTVGYLYDRVSKRLFGNAGTGDFVLGPDVAKPVMGLHFYGMRLSARDYVQDGLIAMWDGIENAGWGVHDASARTWKNLVGDIDLPLDDYPSQIYFTSNSLYTSNGRLAERLDAETIDGPITYESCWVRVNKFNQSTDTRCNYGQCNLDIYEGKFWYKTSSDGGIMSPVNGRAQESVPFTMSVVGTMGGSWETLIPYVNSTQISGLKYSTPIPAQGIRIGSGYNNPTSKHHNIRVYSRALTAEEIAHNYLVDWVRFNLPEVMA